MSPLFSVNEEKLKQKIITAVENVSKTCCSMFGRSKNTDLTCATSQAERILNICEIFHRTLIPLNFLFKFREINLILLNIKPI